jgi:hypothetical protein
MTPVDELFELWLEDHAADMTGEPDEYKAADLRTAYLAGYTARMAERRQ